MILIYEFLTFGLDKLAQACKERNYPAILFTENPNYYPQHLLDDIEVIQIDTKNPTLVIEYIKNNFIITQIKGIVNSTDMFSLYGVVVANAFNLVTNSKETLGIIRNKALLRQKCAEFGIESVQAVQIKSLKELEAFFINVNKPIILKNASGTGSQDIYKISTMEELNILESRLKNNEVLWVAEEFINGTLYSAESICYKGQYQLVGVSSRTLSHEPLFQETSASFPAMLPEKLQNNIQMYISTLLKKLNYQFGYTHIEFMLNKDNQPRLIEVNPRLAGNLVGQMMCDSLGVNVYHNMLCASLGEECLFNELSFKGGASIAILYAPTLGKIKSIAGTKIINQFNDSKYYPVKKIGDEIMFMNDQRANYGVVYAFDQNSSLAYYKAQAIANQIFIEVEHLYAVQSN